MKTTQGPLLVLAGAGSGKTRVITHRIAHLIANGVPAESVLAVTFTNKAAGEMRGRLGRMIGGAAGEATIGTFHALGLSILREEARRGEVPLFGPGSERFVVFDAGDQMACLREIARHTQWDRSLDLGAILSRISTWKNAFLPPERVPDSDDEYDEAARHYYPLYLEQLEAFAAVDFDDLICRPVNLFAQHRGLARRWQERFNYVLVDEYQDTNGAQFRLLRELAAAHGNVCVVGDDDQSIYSWRGALVRNILQFEQDFPGAKVVQLVRNYRSFSPILDVANAVIGENASRHAKQLMPTRGSGPRVKMVLAPDGDAEALWVARFIGEQLAAGRYRADDIAILYRSNTFSRAVETELRAAGLDYRVLGGTAFYETKEVKDFLAYLRLCVNPTDEISLRRVINTPARGIGPRTVARLAEWANERGQPLFRALTSAEEVLGPGDRKAATLTEFGSMMASAAVRLEGRDLAPVARELLGQTGLDDDARVGAASEKVARIRRERLEGLLDGLESYARGARHPTLKEFLSRVALTSLDSDTAKERGKRVTLCTLHGAKGLEFPLVILMGVEEGLLPHERTLTRHITDHQSGDIDEERRLFYVGITRAMDELVLTRTRERVVRGRRQERTPSRFLRPVAETELVVEDLTQPPSMAEVRGMIAELWDDDEEN